MHNAFWEYFLLQKPGHTNFSHADSMKRFFFLQRIQVDIILL